MDIFESFVRSDEKSKFYTFNSRRVSADQMIVRLYYHSIYTNIYTYTQPHVITINEEITEENRHFTHPFIKKESYNSGSKFLTTQYIRDTTFLLHINQRFSPSHTHTHAQPLHESPLTKGSSRPRPANGLFNGACYISIHIHRSARARALRKLSLAYFPPPAGGS